MTPREAEILLTKANILVAMDVVVHALGDKDVTAAWEHWGIANLPCAMSAASTHFEEIMQDFSEVLAVAAPDSPGRLATNEITPDLTNK